MTPEEILARYLESEQGQDDWDEAVSALGDYAMALGMSLEEGAGWATSQLEEAEARIAPAPSAAPTPSPVPTPTPSTAPIPTTSAVKKRVLEPFEQVRAAYEGFLEEARRSLGKNKTEKDALKAAAERFREAYGTTWESFQQAETKRKAAEKIRLDAEKAQKDLLASPTNRQNVLAAYAGGQGPQSWGETARLLRESYQAAGFSPEAAGEKTKADLLKVMPSPETSPFFGGGIGRMVEEAPQPFNVVQSILEQFGAGKRTRQQAFEELSAARQRQGASKTDADVAAQAVMAEQVPASLPFSDGGVLPGQAPFDPRAWPTQPGQLPPSGPSIPMPLPFDYAPFGPTQGGPTQLGQPFRTRREQELFKQSPSQKWASFLAQNPFGQLSASGQETLEEQFGPLLTTFELTQPMGSDFAKFIREGGQKLSPQQFRQKFQEVGGLYGQPFRTAQEEERMKTFRPNPKALGAYLSAFLPTVAPEFEAGARGVAEDIYNRFMAETPDVPFMEFLAKRGGTLF